MRAIGKRLCGIAITALMMVPITPLLADTPAAQSLQADFDAASAAVEAGHCADAEPIFARLASDPRVHPGGLPAATINLRRGLCRLGSGDIVQGEAWVRQGLPIVEAAGPGMAYEASLGWIALARLAAHNYDHDRAVVAYRHVLALPGLGDRLDALTGLAQMTEFDGDGVALALTDRALAVVAAQPAGHDRAQTEARVRTVRSRILMASGRNEEALKEAEKALTLSGGLSTDKVSLTDVSLRADAAQAALLVGHKDRARELLAYTGAGRIAQSPFASARSMNVPDCDEGAGLRPDDVAVVEFSIRPDGRVGEAQTTYTRGSYAVARMFAQAVRGWVWQPETVARLPAFYRALVRVELRCTTSGGGLPQVTALFHQRLLAWARPLLAEGPAAEPGDDRSAIMRRKAGALEAAGDRQGAALVLLLELATDPIAHDADLADSDHAVQLLDRADPVQRASAAAVRALTEARAVGLREQVSGKSGENREDLLLQRSADPAIAADALAQDTLRLQALTEHRAWRFDDREVAVLRAVADDTRLDSVSPLRQVALLRLASVAAHDGRRAEAEALFARTGLNEEQCSLIGDIPRLKNANFDNEYPMEAQAMGFEGWVREEFDIAADGRTARARALIAYPPFVFVAGAKQLIGDARFDTSFRPSGKLACSARTETINFNLPYMH